MLDSTVWGRTHEWVRSHYMVLLMKSKLEKYNICPDEKQYRF